MFDISMRCIMSVDWINILAALSFLLSIFHIASSVYIAVSVVVQQHQGSVCFAFRDAILHILVIMSGFRITVSPFCSDLWHQQSTFTQRRAARWVFSLCQTAHCKLVLVWENSNRSGIFEILRPSRLAPTTTPCLKSCKSPLSSFWCSVWITASAWLACL